MKLERKVVQFRNGDGGVTHGHCCEMEPLLSLKEAISRDSGDRDALFE
jgi:hypothetical protein